MTKLFISYSRKDSAAAQKLIEAFRSIELAVWVDWESLPPAADWLEQIFRAIEEADVFIFLISPDSLVSEVNKVEIDRAVLNKKRIIPIVLRDVNPRDVHAEIMKLNWIFMREQDDFEEALARVKDAITLNLDWVEEHRRLQVRALEWHRKKDPSLLLRGRDLRNARHMVATSATIKADPPPTDLQQVFIQNSLRSERNRQFAWIATAIALLTMTVLTYVAINRSGDPELQRQLDDTQIELAGVQTQLADAQVQLTRVHADFVSVQTQLVQAPGATSAAIISTPPTAATQPSPTVPQPTATASPGLVAQAIQNNRVATVFKWLLAVAGAAFAYGLGIVALVLQASQFGSTFFARSLLSKWATKPLLVTPGLGRKLLFIGYKQRLIETLKIDRNKEYFDVPATNPNGGEIIPDKDGNALHREIIKALGPQRPVVVLGNGGAGKTTLLTHLAALAALDQLPDYFKGYCPIFLTPDYYAGDLVSAIAEVLLKRDRVALDKETLRTQLETGKYLVLFDGISEIEGDQAKGLQEILQTAQNSEFRNCRFIVSSRPNVSIPADIPVFQLHPLTFEFVETLLPRYNLGAQRTKQVLKQLQIFKSKSIEPLLFSMILSQSAGNEISSTLSELYEGYARKLLKIDSHARAKGQNPNMIWKGWSFVMEEIAGWSLIHSGNRGAGLLHEDLIELMKEHKIRSKINEYYNINVGQEYDIIMDLNEAGLLDISRRWRFMHDTFEEYFSAKHILSHLDRARELPDLHHWTNDPVQIQSFAKVMEFIDEMTMKEPGLRTLLLRSNLPAEWVRLLEDNSKELDSPPMAS